MAICWACSRAPSQYTSSESGYQVTVGHDLLEDWTISIKYGRTGQGGREERFAGLQAEAMRAVIRDRLRRRLSAPRRIGCSYRLTTLGTASGFDVWDWLPGDLVAKFFSDANDPSPE